MKHLPDKLTKLNRVHKHAPHMAVSLGSLVEGTGLGPEISATASGRDTCNQASMPTPGITWQKGPDLSFLEAQLH